MLDGKVVLLMKNGMSIELLEGTQVTVNDVPINSHVELVTQMHNNVGDINIISISDETKFVYQIKDEHFNWAYGYAKTVGEDHVD